MTNNTLKILSIVIVLQSLFCLPSLAEEDNKLHFSGFGRFILGHLDDQNAEYAGYTNKLSVNKQSLLGLQADYTFNNKFSVTTQFVAYTEDQRNSGLEWLYATYQPNNALHIKFGRQRIPFFNYSDSLDVGFAYPWLTLPQQFYDTAFFSTFDGILANYEFSISGGYINYEAYWGRFDDKIYLASTEIDTKVIGLVGFNATLGYNNFTLRASYNEGDVNIKQDEAAQFGEILRQLGFDKNADWLNANGLIQFYQFSANYENLDYFVRSEIAKMVGKGGLVADIDSFYVSVGYNFYPYTVYLSYSEKDLHFDHIPNEIPFGLSPEIDTLAYAYQGVLAAFPDDKANGTKIGIRWDWRTNIAIKGEMTFVKGKDAISNDYALKDLGGFDGQAILYQFGIEWVF